MTSKFFGQEEYRHFIGVVENRNDPLQIGRVQIRCYNIHTQDKTILPTESLLWATPQMPVTSSSLKGIGQSPNGIQVGTTVFGYFADSTDSQIPIITGTLAGKGDVHSLSIGINTIKQTIEEGSNEPKSSFASVYPFNSVTAYEGGIIEERDSTVNAIRSRTYHPSGTYSEISNDGRRVDKIVGDSFEIISKGKNVWIKGDLTITVLGNAIIDVKKDAIIGVAGNVVAEIEKDLDINVAGNANISVTGNSLNVTEGNSTIKSNGSLDIQSSEKISINAPVVSINGA